MIIRCTCQCAVYVRTDSSENFTFSHFSMSFYTRAIPSSVSVGALKEYVLEKKKTLDLNNAVVAILVTGDVGEAYSLANWNEAKTTFLYRPEMFPCATRTTICSELEEGYILHRFLSALIMYDGCPESYDYVSQYEFESASLVLCKTLELSNFLWLKGVYAAAISKTQNSIVLTVGNMAKYKCYTITEGPARNN